MVTRLVTVAEVAIRRAAAAAVIGAAAGRWSGVRPAVRPSAARC